MRSIVYFTGLITDSFPAASFTRTRIHTELVSASAAIKSAAKKFSVKL